MRCYTINRKIAQRAFEKFTPEQQKMIKQMAAEFSRIVAAITAQEGGEADAQARRSAEGGIRGGSMTRRLLFATLFLLAVWTAFTIWQITVRESYTLQTRQDALQNTQGSGKVDSTLSTLAQDLDNLSAQVDRLVGSQRENIRRLQPAARGTGEMLMLATGYTQRPEEGTADGITFTGMQVHPGIVAVDRNVIKLGSWLYIQSDFPGVTGYYRAEDVGSAIQGLRVDIYMPDLKTALRFGKRRVRVRIVAAEGVK